jgi:HK97 family phage portal protein
MGLLTRVTRQAAVAVMKAAAAAGYAPSGSFAVEGEYRPGPWYLSTTHGWVGADWGQNLNWWQNGYTPALQGAALAIIEACVSAYSQTVAMCPGDHWRANSKGGRERITNSALSRILRYPNDYQTMSDWLLNAVRRLYLTGNAYALCMRNQRYEISELHLMDTRYCRALIDGEGDVHYALGGNWVVQNRYGPLATVPARDVLHIKLHCDQLRNPLLGQTPLAAAFLDTAAGETIRQQMVTFYNRQSKPGFVLSTDLTLDKDQVSALRDRWNEQTTGANVGGTPILTQGLKPQQIPVTNWKDAQLAEMLKLTDQEIAMAFRVPPQIIGLVTRGMTYGSTEAMMQAWISSGLGFCLNHVEEAFGLTFGLKGQPDEYVEFNSKALLRSNFKDRIEGLARGVQGGIYSPNEARNAEDLDSVEFGDEPRVQQQVVPLSAAGKIPASPAAPSAPPPPGAPAPSQRMNADARRTALKRTILNRTRQRMARRAG